MEYSQFLLLFVVLTAIFCQVQSVGFDVGDTRPSCLQSLKNCKRNSTCKEVYKSVKNKCKAKEAQCNARTADLQQCAMDIAYLREAAFPIDNKCICHGKSLSLKKLVRCSEILNTVYANPCFDVALMASTTSAPDTLGENLGEVAADQGDIKSGVRVSDVEKKMESVSEEDMQDVDALFATDPELRSFDDGWEFSDDTGAFDGINAEEEEVKIDIEQGEEEELVMEEEEEELEEMENEVSQEEDLEEVDEMNVEDVSESTEKLDEFVEEIIQSGNENIFADDEDDDVESDGNQLEDKGTVDYPEIDHNKLDPECDKTIPAEVSNESSKRAEENATLEITLFTCGAILVLLVLVATGFLVQKRRKKINYTSGQFDNRSKEPKRKTFKMRHPTIVIRSLQNKETCLKAKGLLRHQHV
uniref:uncharacterized protein LOC100176486 isoform X2 n=1 Tax=Ciona intestinalis TaxID=7719 RepID=UPI0002B8E909|nr:uncharacterized protein LOC100176486 isoform X2 [Ciona intestinalis]|eukprot:XP_002126721.2 uncharacterized protein LOC100176486 isoform X2 [Ciona intestinalis]